MPKIPLTKIAEGYRTQAEDTNIEIDFFQFQRWQKMSMNKKSQLIIGATQGCRKLSLMGIKNQYPSANRQQKRCLYAQKILG